MHCLRQRVIYLAPPPPPPPPNSKYVPPPLRSLCLDRFLIVSTSTYSWLQLTSRPYHIGGRLTVCPKYSTLSRNAHAIKRTCHITTMAESKQAMTKKKKKKKPQKTAMAANGKCSQLRHQGEFLHIGISTLVHDSSGAIRTFVALS